MRRSHKSHPGTLNLIPRNRAVGTSKHPARQTQFGIKVNPLESQSSQASPSPRQPRVNSLDSEADPTLSWPAASLP